MKSLATMVLTLTLVTPMFAAPPDHAPAHGYRNKPEKHAAKYRGYTGVEWEQDYGVAAGRAPPREDGDIDRLPHRQCGVDDTAALRED